jgi:hypothetical protein
MHDILSLTMLEKEYLDRPQTQNRNAGFISALSLNDCHTMNCGEFRKAKVALSHESSSSKPSSQVCP